MKCLAVAFFVLLVLSRSVNADLIGGTPVLKDTALLTTSVGGLENTNATAQVVSADGPGFKQALRVTIGTASKETNATQLTMPNSEPVKKGDCLLASFYMRGAAAGGLDAAQLAFLFERSTDPWTNSVTQGVSAKHDSREWKHVLVGFASSEDYAPGEAMASLRFAFGPQTLEVGGLSVIDYGDTTTVQALAVTAAEMNPLGDVDVSIDSSKRHQTLLGLGGNFCQPRYGETTAIDAVGTYTINHLDVAQARVGIPINWWAPSPGVYSDSAQAHAAFLLMQLLYRRHIPIIGTVWEGPLWMLPGTAERSGRVLDPAQYPACIDAIAQFLVTARDKYGVTVDYFSFNEPDYGVNFLFTPQTMNAFIRQAGPRFSALGLKTKFLVGDTTGGAPLVNFARPLLEDPQIAPYLGPISFHCWDVLSVSDTAYTQIADLGKEFDKPILCTEGGFDSALWEKPDPWASWDNGLKTAFAYAKTMRLSGASTIDYWTYENNYPLVSADGATPYPVFNVIKQLSDALPSGSKVVDTASPSDDLCVLATVGPSKREWSVLLVNTIGSGKVTITGLPAGANATITRRTEATSSKAVVTQAKVNADGRLTADIETRAVVTVTGGSL